MNPAVSAVLTTRNRPQLVERAVRSALGQTLRDLEVIVIVDGPCPETTTILSSLADPRLSVHVMKETSGQAAAMNEGVARARGEWVAFLDDDDQWLPEKIELQLEAAKTATCRHPVLATRVIARGDEGEFFWPLRLPDPTEDLSEYLFCQRGLKAGEGMVLPSTTMASRELLVQHPMTEGLKRHVDLDWLLRVNHLPGVCIHYVAPERPLAIYDIGTHKKRISNSADWRYSLEWARDRSKRMTRRARGAFLLVIAGSTARRAKDWRAFPFLLAEAFRFGRPNTAELTAYFLIWLLPISLRRFLTRSRSRENIKQ
jgi:glycosyltransferase involved in cell wall biosynthesis